MSFFLFKPHVIGPEGKVTSPDVIVDRVFVNGAVCSVALLTSEIWQQVGSDETATAAYAVAALGGGALISPALMLGCGIILVARKAWRLNNLDGHIGDVTLNGARMSTTGLPSEAIKAAGGRGDALPRGYMLLKTTGDNTTRADLADPVLARALTHRVVFEAIDHDRWGTARPRPRYSVGPTKKDVPHFI